MHRPLNTSYFRSSSGFQPAENPPQKSWGFSPGLRLATQTEAKAPFAYLNRRSHPPQLLHHGNLFLIHALHAVAHRLFA
jgi:hypothetical protein